MGNEEVGFDQYNFSNEYPDDLLSEKEVIEEKPYNPRKQEDKARRIIAYFLLGLLAFIVAWSLITITIFPDQKENIVDILQIILLPVIALVSAATGFYYGSKNTDNS